MGFLKRGTGGHRCATQAELRVIGALLGAGADRRAAALLEQVATSKVVARDRPAPDRFVLSLEYVTTEPVTSIVRAVTTPWVGVRDAESGEPLELRVHVHRGGMFSRLEGRAPGGRWPAAWRVADETLDGVPPATLPARPSAVACVAAVRMWLGVDEQVGPKVKPQCFDPAGAPSIAEAERREGHDLPSGCRALLATTDGLELGRRGGELHGIADLFVTELDGAPWWVVGELDDEPLVIRVGAGGDERVVRWPHDVAGLAGARVLAPDLAAYVRSLVFPTARS